MFKKKIAVVLVALTLVTVSSAFAAPQSSLEMNPRAAANYETAPCEVQNLVLSDSALRAAAPYAYMDLDTAPEALKGEIVAAREKIIFNDLAWADGGGYIKYPDGTIEVLPEFSDLFPGWDLPEWKTSDVTSVSTLGDFDNLDVLTVTNHAIPHYNASVTTPTMVDNVRSNSVETFAVVPTRLSMSACNISIGQGNTVKEWKQNVRVGGECHIFPTVGARYNVRVSTNYSAGTGSFNIYH